MDNLLDIAKRRLNPGILIFDMDHRLTCANNEAFNILSAIEKITLQNKEPLFC